MTVKKSVGRPQLGKPVLVVMSDAHREIALSLSPNKKIGEGVRVALDVAALLGYERSAKMLLKAGVTFPKEAKRRIADQCKIEQKDVPL